MASKKEFIYKVDTVKKVVYIDESVAISDADKIQFSTYISEGYRVHKKSAAKVAQGKKMAEKNKLGKKKAAATKQ